MLYIILEVGHYVEQVGDAATSGTDFMVITRIVGVFNLTTYSRHHSLKNSP